jgi:Predicted transcriptional regulators
MAIDYESIGKRIKSYRTSKGLSQETFGEKIFVNNQHISRIESGKSKPSLDLLVAIANLLGVSADDLLVDSLDQSVSIAGSDIHKLLLDCTDTERRILTGALKALKELLSQNGI